MKKNIAPTLGTKTTAESTTVSVCAWPTGKLDQLENDANLRRLANNYGVELSYADLGDTFDGVPHVRVYATATMLIQAAIGKGYILAMSDALDADDDGYTSKLGVPIARHQITRIAS